MQEYVSLINYLTDSHLTIRTVVYLGVCSFPKRAIMPDLSEFNTSFLDQLASLHPAPLLYLVPLSLDGVEYNETPMGISRLHLSKK